MISFSKPTISKKDLVHVLEAMLSDKVESGEVEKRFEKEFASYVGASNAVAMTSTGAALYFIFELIGLLEGDEVVVPAYGDPLILEILSIFKATPVFVDLAEATYHIDLTKIEAALTEKTKAVIVSHLFGFPIDVPENFLADKNVLLIEDMTQVLGAKLSEAKLPIRGHYAYFSTDSEALITTGQGGVIVCKKKVDSEALQDKKSKRVREEIKSRIELGMSDLLAAMGLSELSLVERFLSKRREIAKFYRDCLARGVNVQFAPLPTAELPELFFPVEFSSPKKQALELFKKYKIQAREPYPKALFEYGGHSDEFFPHARRIDLKTLLIPLYPVLRHEEVEEVGKLLANIR
jgi:perosamine synthetase